MATDEMQPEDSRCPPTYRREEAVKALIGMGWTWNGFRWSAPATLRQQAGRVDADAVTRACNAYFDALPVEGGESANREAMRAALTAALAQNTQGEVVGDERRHYICVCPDCMDRRYAERARVPDGGLSAVITYATLAGVGMDVDMSYFGPNQVGPGDKVRVFVVEKAAAPSQPEDAWEVGA